MSMESTSISATEASPRWATSLGMNTDPDWNRILGYPSVGSASSMAAMWTGRTDTNKRCVFPVLRPLANSLNLLPASVLQSLRALRGKKQGVDECTPEAPTSTPLQEVHIAPHIYKQSEVVVGDYVVVYITEARAHTLRGVPVAKSSIQEYFGDSNPLGL